MTTQESVWERLHRIAESRRLHLHMTQEGVRAAGGPSVSWQTKLPYKTETPGPRHVDPLNKLDRALAWREGTSMRILTQDVSHWGQVALDDEESSLINGPDRIEGFAHAVELHLRTLDPEVATQVMRQIAPLIGLPPPGD